MQHVAAQRMNAFVRYLDPNRYKITVVASTNCDSEGQTRYENANIYYVKGNSLLKLRKQSQGMAKWKHVLFSLNNKLIRFFSKSDLPGWEYNVLNKLKEINSITKIDFLLTTFFPLDSHLIGINFKKQNTGICWIADMRDEMSQNKLLSLAEQRSLSFYEREISKYVDVVSSVSKPILDGFRINMTRDDIKFIEIRNGFDHDNLPIDDFNKEFTFCYAGTFYGKRKPDTFFKALLKLNHDKKLPYKWKVRFIGTPENFSIPTEFKENVEFVEQIPNKDVISFLQHADCNLLIHPPTGAKGIFTGKLFDYLSVEKPILAMVDCNDVAAELINACCAGYVIDFYDINGIYECITKIIGHWQKHEKLKYNSELIKTLHRSHQVKKLEMLLTTVSK